MDGLSYPARRSRVGKVASELARCELTSSQSASSSRPRAGPGRRVRARWIASSQVVSSLVC
ncbi:UNVERIFIED_CONTAM: hypothetical protein Sradi_1910000 [Sesamum radiatum]|uniref:Uncharacterized protein n=1 Tax=Sesamum radiatum TaxID=300843 RepID=A0AAW2U1R8_SESRA